MPGKGGQNFENMPSLWRHLQKTPNRQRKTFFSISTRRLAESVEGLNSSLAAGDFWPKKGWLIAAVKGLIMHWKKIYSKLIWQVIQRFFSSHLCKQSQLLIRSFPFPKHFSSWHINKTTTTDFKTCKKQCTQWLRNSCSLSSNCRNHCVCWGLKGAYVNCKMSVYAQ